MEYKVEKANVKNLEDILELYRERTEWFKENKISQWTRYLERHPKLEFKEAIKNGNYYIIKEQENIIAGFELSTNSEIWEDEITPAYYLYKVVTKVGYKGIGKAIINKSKEMAKKDGKKYIRLNCLKSNAKLNQIYESYDFQTIRYSKKFSLKELKIKE